MAIDPSVLAQVKWDDAPAPAAGQQPLEIDITGGVSESQLRAQQSAAAAQQPIDLDQVVWDDAPGAAAPAAPDTPSPANSSAFARMVSGQPAVPQVQEGTAIGRFLGEIGGRQVLQGAAGLYGALGGDAVNHYVLDPIDSAAGWGTQLGTGGQSYHDAAGQVADEMGMRRPANARERVIGDIGEALTGTALTMGIGSGVNALANLGRSGAAPVTNRLAELLTANPGLQAVSTATGAGASSATREAGGGTGLQIAAGLFGGLAPGAASGTAALAGRALLPNRLAQLIPEPVGAVPTAVAGGTRRAMRGQDAQGLRDTIAAFDAAGTAPSVGQATGSRTAQALESYLGNAPGGAGRIERMGRQQQEQVRGRLDEMSNAIAPNGADLTPQQVGATVQQGITGQGGFIESFRKTSKKLYDELNKLMPPNTPVRAMNTDTYLTGITARTPGASNTSDILVDPFMDKLTEALQADMAQNGGSLPYRALVRVRSMVGEKIDGAGLNPDFDIKQLRALYASLSEDMNMAVAATGNPRAIQLMERANNYYDMGSKRIEQIEKIIEKNGGSEAAYMALFNGAQNGATSLRRVMGALPAPARAEVTASFLQRMGRAVKGQRDSSGDSFSMRTFLTNWADLSPEARKELFRSARYGSDFRNDVDQIARVADKISAGSRVFQNTSGTARQLALGATLGGTGTLAIPQLLRGDIGGAAQTVAGAVLYAASNNLGARLMTNPRAVNWLATNTKRDAGDLVAQIQVLRQAGERSDDQETVQLADDLKAQVGAPRQ
ncbi:hypothetical protein AB8810_11150 [Xanthomonas sp. NCPPB 3005]|uniref:hypothetical protein n=1 Tax=Xanthomonas sp. NCPPB 3005 TaxID=3240913 RepID=UPI003517720B